MSTLLHIDSSAMTQGSVSREVAGTFRQEWQAAHPDGTVVHRDLAVTQVPHLSAAAITAQFSSPRATPPSSSRPSRCARS